RACGRPCRRRCSRWPARSLTGSAEVAAMQRISVEIGGTFTDLVTVDGRGRLSTVKLASTPDHPERAALDAVARAAAELPGVEAIIHGSTIATNSVIERTGARVGLLVTAGFGDILHLQRQDR